MSTSQPVSQPNGAVSQPNGAVSQPRDTTGALPTPVAVLAWLWVLVPFGYGVYNLVIRAQNLFG